MFYNIFGAIGTIISLILGIISVILGFTTFYYSKKYKKIEKEEVSDLKKELYEIYNETINNFLILINKIDVITILNEKIFSNNKFESWNELYLKYETLLIDSKFHKHFQTDILFSFNKIINLNKEIINFKKMKENYNFKILELTKKQFKEFLLLFEKENIKNINIEEIKNLINKNFDINELILNFNKKNIKTNEKKIFEIIMNINWNDYLQKNNWEKMNERIEEIIFSNKENIKLLDKIISFYETKNKEILKENLKKKFQVIIALFLIFENNNLNKISPLYSLNLKHIKELINKLSNGIKDENHMDIKNTFNDLFPVISNLKYLIENTIYTKDNIKW